MSCHVLLCLRAGAGLQALKQEEYTSQQLAEYFQELFRIADTDGNGTLSPAEVRCAVAGCVYALLTALS